MATTHVVHHNESHGNHPMSVVGFCALLSGFGAAGIWIVHLASDTQPSTEFGIAALVLFLIAGISLRTVSAHSRASGPLVPENTEIETRRYLDEYRAA